MRSGDAGCRGWPGAAGTLKGLWGSIWDQSQFRNLRAVCAFFRGLCNRITVGVVVGFRCTGESLAKSGAYRTSKHADRAYKALCPERVANRPCLGGQNTSDIISTRHDPVLEIHAILTFLPRPECHEEARILSGRVSAGDLDHTDALFTMPDISTLSSCRLRIYINC